MSRSVLVTGGAKGIGHAVVRRFLDRGDRVLAIGRDAEALERSGASATEVCDVSDEDAVGRLFATVGPLDVLVNNAGVSGSALLSRTSLADWTTQLGVNATGAFLCTRAALPGMLDRDRGRIVTVASTAGKVGTPYTAAYTASKHAAVGLMRAVAAEVAGTGVTANAVCPTFVRTEMTQRSIRRISERTGRSSEEASAALAESTPLGRLLEPEEVAYAVVFLAAEEAGAINGQTLVLDGGALQ